ncbi:aminotransferase-like domain-containing protein [Singulisphaera acidiphila]|uniref:Transcriptional regulator with HTH domain and aminotransferase domain n=1 Tax=Singulisphaera acidiphila (strain ATCC BAA-1392 / DSM 18658 / VKM B-2454 / MOB10) TaxID=886293 RepID=L0DCG5_SINAD|nr:PLP-dependent aminotransferase family protein [Singulisphaera acidiphila]AGA26560.1 transcriptional regulator with HTH domain and aminotransferase domain [Singulisphaera acidiphila DSM 18658]
MTSPTQLSVVSERTSVPAISTLMHMALATPGLISLAAGFVDQQSLPVALAAEEIAAILADEREGRRALQYGTTIGDHQLRERLMAFLEQDERVPSGTYQHCVSRTVVTTGSQQLLYLISEALLDPGDIVLVESPTYFVYLGVLETRGVRVVGVDIDEGGLRLDALESTLAGLDAKGLLNRVKLIYTISEHSNPSGISLAADRRQPLVDLAKKWSKHQTIFILEDSAYRGLTFDGVEPPSVWSYDPDGETVILARTFSKTFSPGFKTGYGVLPATLLEPVLRLKGNHDFGSGNFAQIVLERAIGGGGYQRHVATLVERYRRKRDVMIASLVEWFGDGDGAVQWTYPQGGLYVWLSLPNEVDTGPDGPFFARCLERGVLYVPGTYAYADATGSAPRNHARLCFGVPSEADLAEGARRLSLALTDCLNPVA